MRTEINRAVNSRNEDGRVTPGKALDQTPQAKDDLFSLSAVTGNTDQTFILDVMANDGGGNAKSLWSIDDGIGPGSTDLLTGDGVDIAESSIMGAHISITADGKVAYSYTPELLAKLVSLPADKSLIDTFVYAIRLGNGVLSWATATVEIAGVNDPPVLSGTLIDLNDGEVNASYRILESDLLIGFSDPEGDVLSVANLVATNGVLTEMPGGWFFTPDTDFTGAVELQYSVIDGHGGSVPVNQSFMIIDPSDTTAPQLISNFPWDEGTLKIDQNIVLDFDESVVAGSGNIIISSGIDTRVIDINDTNQVTFISGEKGGSSIVIDPTDDLIVDTQYTIQIASGVIQDASGNTYEGINDPETLNFITTASNPLLNWSNLWYEGTLKIDNNIELYFDEPVVAGSGAIIISNGSDTRTIDIQDATQVMFDGYAGVIINPTDDLIPDTNYHIQIAAGAILDTSGHAYAGINDTETLDFMTTDPEPLLYWSNPGDEGILKADNNIELYFDESVVAGSGAIIISNGSDTRTIDIQDATQVMFDGYAGVIINPVDDLIPDTNYHIQIAAGAILDANGHAYAGINDTEALDFMTIASDPLLSWSNPWDEETLKADNNIELYFDEPVVAGSGAIIISNGSDTRTIDIQDTTQVMFDGYNGVIINPLDDLISDTNYHIQIAAGAILDTNGRAYAGISDNETLNFMTTAPEPLLYWSNPGDEGTLKVDNNIELYFDEPVVAGSGAIIISNGSDTRTIDIQDATQVMFDGYGGVIIDPVDDLLLETNYYIQIAAGAILDTGGHAYDGVNDNETLNFMTIGSEPLLGWSNPGDEGTLKVDSNIELYFDEPVVAGSGAIIISNGSDTRTIDINDTDQVIFTGGKSGNSIIIDPTEDLIADTSYHIQIAPSAVLDNEGHTYAGINNPDTLSFTTIDSSPLLAFSYPGDDATEVWVGSDISLYFDEWVTIGAGNITISNGVDIRTIDIQDSSQVMFDGYSSVYINPAIDLIPNTDYFIQMDSGVVTDLAGNPYAGIQDATTLNFSTTDSLVTTMILPPLLEPILF